LSSRSRSHKVAENGQALSEQEGSVTMQTLTRHEARPTPVPGDAAPAQTVWHEGPPVRRVLALLSGGAAVLHFGFAPGHLDEAALHGAFFVAVGWLQLLWALAVWTGPSRRLLVLGLLNAVVVGVWVVSRTVGVPFGEDGGSSEAVGFPDVLASVLEGAIVLASGALLVRGERTPVPRGRPGRLLPLVAAVAVVTATATAFTPRFAAGHAHGETTEVASSTGPPGAAGEGHTHAGAEESGNIGVQNPDQAAELQPDKPLDPATRDLLAQQLTTAREAALRYPTLADALAAGMFPAGEFTPGAGAHYLSPGGAAASFLGGGGFDPASPATWIYDGMSPTSRVVGLMWISGAKEAPEGFAGPNDHWHRHFNTCIRAGKNGIAGIEVPFAADRDVTREMCEAVGGSFMDTTVWMVHAWVVPSWESPNGVFSHDNPNLRCADGTTDTDDRGFCQGT
jgi:hypothetical protein